MVDKSNEITAIPSLLKQLEIEGIVVTIDAIDSQVEIAEQVVGKGNGWLFISRQEESQGTP